MVHSRHAEGAYQLNWNAPLISRLSEVTYNPSKWQNKPPKALLEEVYPAHRYEVPGGSLLYKCHDLDKDTPSVVVCELSFLAPWERSGVVVYKSEKCLSRKDAQNSVAFQALKKFKEFHENRAPWLLPWMERGEREKTACEGRVTKIPRLVGDFSVLGEDPGGEGPPPLGTVVTIDYIIRWKTPHIESSFDIPPERNTGPANSSTVKRGEVEKGTAESSLEAQKGGDKVEDSREREEEAEIWKWTEVIEANKQFKFEFGSGSVIEPLNSCVSSLKEGQTARFFLTLPHSWVFEVAKQRFKGRERGFTDGLSFPLSELVECEVKLVGFERLPEERIEGAFFSPPLSKQRLSFALNLIENLGVKTLVDLGCGSGALFKQLPGKCMVENFVGVDISSKALRVAAKAMEKAVDNLRCKDSGGTWNSDKLKSAILYQGSITEFDLRIQGFDLATCIEVVEHLDPEPLNEVGQAILGNLQPKVLLISTPNIEYNLLLQSAGGKGVTTTSNPLEDIDFSTLKLRNEDHRFEWTRNEFKKWANKIATSYGYSVEYTGVGGNGEEPGFATQIAVFTREEEGLGCERSQQTKQETNVNVYEIVWRWPDGSNI